MIVSSPIWPHNASPCLISHIGPYLGPPFALHVRTFSATDATRERSHAWMSYERFQGVIPRCCGSAGCDRACESWPQSILHLDPHNPPCSFQSKEQIRALKAQKKEPVQVSVWPLSALQAWHGVHAWRWLTPLLHASQKPAAASDAHTKASDLGASRQPGSKQALPGDFFEQPAAKVGRDCPGMVR